MFRKLGTLAVSLLLATGLALPAGDKGDWELGVFTGYALVGDYEGSRSDLRDRRITDDDLNLDDDLLFGARVGYFLTSKWSLEASFQHFSTEAKFDRCVSRPCPGTPQETANPDADLDSLRFNLLYHWRRDAKVAPFFTVGLGLEGTDIESVMDENDLGYNAGMGVRFLLGNRLSIRVDGRYVIADVSSPVDDFQASLQGSVGLSWMFGGEATP
jgi:outer membrane beta-barrel protein